MKKTLAAVLAVTLWFLPTAASANYGSGTIGNWPDQTHGTFGNLATAEVIFVGDSLLTGGRTELAAYLAERGITSAGSYWSGRPLSGLGAGVDWALSLSRKPPVLVMFATNDIFDPSVVTTYLRKLKAGLPATTRLILVDVQAARPDREGVSTTVADQRNSMWVNTQIRTEIPAANVCGWSVGFASKPSRITAYLRPDGVHPIEGVGTEYWAAVVGGCVDRALN